jgi:hypothetical protein
MAVDLDFLNPSYKPALLALSAEDTLAVCREFLRELSFKVLVAGNHDDFIARFNNIQFQLVVIDESFASRTPDENVSLHHIKNMPMNHRRHTTIVLLGHTFQTLHPMQAFAHSVHAVVNWADFGSISQVIQQVVADNNLFLGTFRESQARIASRG